MDFYATLSEIFPRHSRDKLKEVIDYVNDEDGIDDPDDFKYNRMVSLLLEEEDPPDSSDEGELFDEAVGFGHAAPDANTLHARLVEMLPKVDPSYILEESEKVSLRNASDADVDAFINDMLDKTDLPTIEDYNKRKAEKADAERYTCRFNIEDFLKEFPDPFTVFKKSGRVHSLSKDQTLEDQDDYKKQLSYALSVLYNLYGSLHTKDVDAYMRHFKNDIIKACDKLDKLPKAFKVMRPAKLVPQCPPKNRLLLQELAFVQYRKQIKQYMQLKNESYNMALAEARREGLLETCQCCFDEELIPEECYFCMGDCIFCRSCVKLGTETAIGDGKLQFPCFNSSCDKQFSMATLQMVLDPVVFYRMEQRKQIDDIRKANVDGFETCPFCDYGTVPDPADKVFYCQNEECMKESCRECRHPSHVPMRCNEIEYDEDVKIRTYIENKMTEALLRKCSNCGKQFIKETGCNKMTCSCGTTMCYICGQSNITYSHFENGCELHSDLQTLHGVNVRLGADRAKKDLGIDRDPNLLKFDPTKNMSDFYNNFED